MQSKEADFSAWYDEKIKILKERYFEAVNRGDPIASKLWAEVQNYEKAKTGDV